MASDYVSDGAALAGILDMALAASKADETEALAFASESALTRYTHNYIHENMVERNWQLSVRAVVGKRIGVAGTNRFDPANVKLAVERATEMARMAPEDPDFPGLPSDTGPCDDAPAQYDAATARLAPEARARAVEQIIEVMSSRGLYAAGYVSTRCDSVAVANSKGVRRTFAGTDSAINIKAIGETSSGYAEGYARRFADLSPSALAERAARKAVESKSPQALAPGEYTVILEAPAFREFLIYLTWIGFGAQPYEQGSSFMAGKLGQKIAGDNVTFRDQFAHPLGAGIPFDFEGAPRRQVTLIDAGVAKDVVYDSYYAAKLKHANTGHALPAPNTDGPMPLNIVVPAGSKPEADLIRGIDRGVLVTRTWYIRLVDQKQTLITGMTRDGLFRIERGEVTHGLKNMRFNESILGALNRCELSRELVRSESHVLPATKIEGFRFTSGTEFG